MGETIYESSTVEAKIDGSPRDADELRLAQMGHTRELKSIRYQYVGLPCDHPQSYHSFMDKSSFKHIDIDASNINNPDGNAASLTGECDRANSWWHGQRRPHLIRPVWIQPGQLYQNRDSHRQVVNYLVKCQSPRKSGRYGQVEARERIDSEKAKRI
ncbi:hypothetical protein CNMCM5623_003758 [Aspergillus felis]|uniref:Uncharacterized protein n=1 Tax=Aspergillus felis TaxID=1287682 RepID=A0A8H6QG71_9EURO|nr:hypothetical protein CNMCM5623_003758 [Aspergillus felis]KAF7183257.1 hypothetical protein CNMCM7691_003170 [Aspergillus felis]